MKYDNFSDLIPDLIDGEDAEGGILSVDNINEDLFKAFKDQKPDFWKYLLEYMNQHGSIKQQELLDNQQNPEKSSLFGYINQKADLDYVPDEELNDLNKVIGKFWGRLMESYSNGEELDATTATGKVEGNKNYYWNESLSKAISLFLLSFDLEIMKTKERQDAEKLGISPKDIPSYQAGLYDLDRVANLIFENGIKVSDKGITHFHISDIINADAGVDFDGAPWVRPQYNIDAELYKNIRGTDKIESVLNSARELQYTVSQEQDPHWIRLLMPKYLRYVEVEDLNRNFWVIGQTIAAISAFLFGDESPLTELLKDMLNEIAQLWQNIMYLWAAATLLMQESAVNKTHTEVVIIPNSELESYIKFDNFSNELPITDDSNLTINWTALKNRVYYLIEQYHTCNLIIIPCIRYDNYKHNYYREEIYPGMILYNRNNDEYTEVHFKDIIRINVDKYQDVVYAIRETEDQYQYYCPYSTEVFSDKVERYYALLRTETNIVTDFYRDLKNNKWTFKIDQFDILVYDRALEVLNYSIDINQSKSCLVGKYVVDNFIAEEGNKEIETNVTFKAYKKAEDIQPINEIQYVNIVKGFYQGELVSQWNAVMTYKYNIKIDSITVPPILYFNSSNLSNSQNGHSQVLYDIILNNIKKKDGSTYQSRFNKFLTENASLMALQYVYDAESGYYLNADGTPNNNGYNQSKILQHLKDKGVNIDKFDIETDNFANTFDFDEYLKKFNQEDYDKKLTIAQKFYLSAIFFQLLDLYDILENLPKDKDYSTIPYVAGATVKAKEFDKRVLEIYGKNYVKQKYGSSLEDKNFILVETSRSETISRGPRYYRDCIIVVDDKGKVVNTTFEENSIQALIDAGAGVSDPIEDSKYFARSYFIYGQSPLGDQRYSGLMMYPNGNTFKLYNDHFEIFRADKNEYGAFQAYIKSISYNDMKFTQPNEQWVYTKQQNLIMTINGEPLREDNWCAVTVKTQYITNCNLFWDDSFKNRTYFEKYMVTGKKGNIITREETIEEGRNYEFLQLTQQKNLYEVYKNDIGEGLWIGQEDDAKYFVNVPLGVQNTVSVFRHDGKYAQRIYIRNCVYSERQEDGYLKWKYKIDRPDGQDDVDKLRENYKVVINSMPGYNWEKYKSNGLYVPGDGSLSNSKYPLDDDTSSYKIEAVDNSLKTEYEQ